MIRFTLLSMFLFISNICFAEADSKAYADSGLLDIRCKADAILEKLDLKNGKIILYSIPDKDYYVICRQNQDYTEMKVKVDSLGNILSVTNVNHIQEIKNLESKKILTRKKKALLSRLVRERQMIMKSFDAIESYPEVMKRGTDVTWTTCGPFCYFVMKDERNNRYGECYETPLTFPCLIDPALLIYLFMELCEIPHS